MQEDWFAINKSFESNCEWKGHNVQFVKATTKLKLCKTGNIAVLDFYISIQFNKKFEKLKISIYFLQQ